MSVYVGAPIGTGGIVRLPVCFTGWHAILMRGVLMGVVVVTGMIGGAVLGFLFGLITGPEVVSKIASVAVGAAAFGIVGAVAVVAILNKSMCPCPAGATGFCIAFVVFIPPGSLIVIPIWPFFTPAPGRCATLVPPGCP